MYSWSYPVLYMYAFLTSRSRFRGFAACPIDKGDIQKRNEWDSNPRSAFRRTPDFESDAINQTPPPFPKEPQVPSRASLTGSLTRSLGRSQTSYSCSHHLLLARSDGLRRSNDAPAILVKCLREATRNIPWESRTPVASVKNLNPNH